MPVKAVITQTHRKIERYSDTVPCSCPSRGTNHNEGDHLGSGEATDETDDHGDGAETTHVLGQQRQHRRVEACRCDGLEERPEMEMPKDA